MTLGLPSVGDAYQLPNTLPQRGWARRTADEHIMPYDTVVYMPDNPDYQGDGYGHVGWAVPGADGLVLRSYLNGEWQTTPLHQPDFALYSGVEK